MQVIHIFFGVFNMRSPLLLSLILSLGGCGLQNQEKKSSGTFPTIDMSIPSNASTGALALAGDSNVFTEHGERMESIIAHVNKVMDRLNSSKNLEEKGTSSFEAEDGKKISVSIADGTGSYKKQAIICTESKPHMFMEWNDSVVHIRKDWNQDAWRVSPSPYKAEMLFDRSSGTLEIYGYGVPWTIPPEIASDTANGGSFNAEYLKGTLNSDGSFELQAVRAWDVSAVTKFTGDVWFSGKLNADGSGTGKAYRRWNTAQCGLTTFDEASANWCLGLMIAADGSSQKMAALGISDTYVPASESKLKVIDLSDVACP